MCMFFLDRCLSFSFGYCVVCSSSTYRFWLSLWYLQTLLKIKNNCGNVGGNNKLIPLQWQARYTNSIRFAMPMSLFVIFLDSFQKKAHFDRLFRNSVYVIERGDVTISRRRSRLDIQWRLSQWLYVFGKGLPTCQVHAFCKHGSLPVNSRHFYYTGKNIWYCR